MPIIVEGSNQPKADEDRLWMGMDITDHETPSEAMDAYFAEYPGDEESTERYDMVFGLLIFSSGFQMRFSEEETMDEWEEEGDTVYEVKV